MAKNGKGSGNGHVRKAVADLKPPAEKSYPGGDPCPERIGRTWDVPESGRTKYTFAGGTERVPGEVAPATINRSWSVDAEIEVPKQGGRGPIVVMGGDTNGWSLYLDGEGVPTFCYNLAAIDLTYIRGKDALSPGRHVVRYEFEKTGKETFGAGGVGRLFVAGKKIAEGEIQRTSAFHYSLDETLDIGCDKSSPVTPEYPPLASFTGNVIKVDMDLKPNFSRDTERHHHDQLEQMTLRE